MPRITYGEKYTVKASGSLWKPVNCLYCGCSFVYLINHTASGSAENPLWLNRQGAINKAEDRAYKNLEKQIKNINLNYHCPECGYFQPDMISRMKLEIWKKAVLTSIATGAVSAFLIAIVLSLILPLIISEPQWQNFISLSTSIFCGVGLATLVGSIILLKLVNFNPNKNAASRKGQIFSESYPVIKT